MMNFRVLDLFCRNDVAVT